MESDNEIVSLYKQGKYLYDLKSYTEAKEYFIKCIQLSHKERYSINGLGNFNSKLMLARIFKEENNIIEAIKQYIEAVFDPNNTERVGLRETKDYLIENNQTEILEELNSLINSSNNSKTLIQLFKDNQKYFIDYPKEVHIETTGRCNASCVFCPHSELERKNTDMTNELFHKIITDLKNIPSNIKFHISPFKVNELLLDKDIFNKIEMINNELPNAYIRLFSNFNAATHETPIKISKIKNLSSLDISLNSLNEDEYKTLMNLNLSKTISNIKSLLEYNKNNKFIDKIILSRVGDGTDKDTEFINDVNSVFSQYKNQIEILVVTPGEWINFIKSKEKKLQDNPCLRWFEISITCTGKVSFCCMDGKCEYSIGDVHTQSILEIYNSKTYREYRLNGYQRKFIVPCNMCSYD